MVLVDFQNEFPDRRAGIGQIFLNDIDDAIEDVHFIKDNGLRGGLLLPKEAPQEIANGLERLRDHPGLRRRLGIAARRRVEQNFSLQAVGAALDALLSGDSR